jgi:hypothetical protein
MPGKWNDNGKLLPFMLCGDSVTQHIMMEGQ